MLWWKPAYKGDQVEAGPQGEDAEAGKGQGAEVGGGTGGKGHEDDNEDQAGQRGHHQGG